MKIKLLAPHTDGGRQYAVNEEVTADARLLDKLSRLGVGYEVVSEEVPESKKTPETTTVVDAVKPTVVVQSAQKKQQTGGSFFKKSSK